MAKLSVVNRESKRLKLVAKYKARREELKARITNPDLSPQEREDARIGLQRLPRNASPIRLRSRCRITGRAHGVYRKFGLGRNKLREAAMMGDVPGLVKASW